MAMIKRLAKPKNVAVRFVGDEDFIQNITPLEEKKSGRKRADIVYDHIKDDHVPLEDTDDGYEFPSALCPSENEINGQELFQVSVKKPNKNMPKGKKIHKTPKNTPNGTPRSSSKTLTKYTPKRLPVAANGDKTVNSPYSLRVKRTQNILDEPEDDSDLEASSFEESGKSDSSDGDTFTLNKQNISSSTKKKKNTRALAEDYFSAQKNSKTVTSNRTMSKVSLPKTNIHDLKKILWNTREYHKSEKASLYRKYKSMFRKWSFLLLEGFNVLLYGVGSKHFLLKKFCSEILSDALCLVINGFYPSLTVKQVLNTITESIINHEGTFSNMFEQVDFIKDHFASESADLYIVVHNIDGQSLRGVKCQTVFSSLAASPKIHFIASVDHFNCSLIWDQIMLSQFRWVWYNVSTYEPYLLETSYENSLLREQSSQLVLSSLMHVFQSLTPNNQGVFLVLAKYQMEKKDNAGYLGITFQDWYQECREAFLVNSESTMNAQMSEFKNHKLLASRKSGEGIEYWYIPVDGNTLSQFLERDTT